MTDNAKELLALADAYLANNAAETGADELIRQLRDALPAAPGEPCAVKPLEWRDHSFKDYEEHIASWGDYHITKDETCDWPYILRPFIAGQSNFQTLYAAKAAAQADYEKRIRSALVTTPQSAAGWDDDKLPCDVHLPQATYISAGCKVSTLMTAIKQREAWPEEGRKFRREAPAPAEGVKPSSIVTCCVTGAIPGDGGACGDCDPCIMGETSAPEPVKRLIAEKNSLLQRVGELEDAAAAGASASAEARLREDDTIQTLLDLLNPLHGEIDRQTYDDRLKENFDAPAGAEYNVNITARMERDLTQAVLILEDRKRQALSPLSGGDEVQDTWLVGGADLKAMSGDAENDRVIKLHFRRHATDADRAWLLDAINAKIASDRAAAGGDEAKESDGGVPPFGGYGSAEAAIAAADGNAQTIHETFKALRKIIDVAYDALAMTWDQSGMPGPSDPTAAERREIVARIVEPGAFHDDPMDRHKYCRPRRVDVVQAEAFAKADAILAALDGGR